MRHRAQIGRVAEEAGVREQFERLCSLLIKSDYPNARAVFLIAHCFVRELEPPYQEHLSQVT